jgi:hypothetical protein
MLTAVVKQLPLQTEFKIENKWDKTKDWRKAKLIHSESLSTVLFEVGKVTVKYDCISENDLKDHLLQDY